MFIQYYKGDPNHQILIQRNGKIRRSGLGLSFWYTPHNTNILAVPATSLAVGFSMNEHTQDHQELHVHGSVSFRINDPEQTASRLPFDIDPETGHPTTEGRQLLESRIITSVQSHFRPLIQAMTFEAALRAGDEWVDKLESQLASDPELAALGIVVEGVHLQELTPAPELRTALEAEYREALNQRADDAIYTRRFSAQRQEARLAKEKLEAEIEREKERESLVERQTTNQLKLAEAEAESSRLKLGPYAELSGQALLGLALKEFAEQPQHIGQLNLTPDLLSQVAGWMSQGNGSAGHAN